MSEVSTSSTSDTGGSTSDTARSTSDDAGHESTIVPATAAA